MSPQDGSLRAIARTFAIIPKAESSLQCFFSLSWGPIQNKSINTSLSDSMISACRFVLFCFVWLATLGLPVVASRTGASTFRRVVEAP